MTSLLARRPLALLVALFALLVAAFPAASSARTLQTTTDETAHTGARQVIAVVRDERSFELEPGTTHVALHWPGDPNARVEVAFERQRGGYSPWQLVERDEVGEQRRDGRTYGALMSVVEQPRIRVRSSQVLRLAVLKLSDRGRPVRGVETSAGAGTAAVDQPPVISRAGWGADESLRFNRKGDEIWPPEFHPVQKLFVHHTATTNDDPDPAATIRSIYYYHAVTQGWGDIGYSFLLDEQGNVYEGRYSREYASGEDPTGEDLEGLGVTGAHAYGYNSGTVGSALLGTLTDRDATAAARDGLERLLAWKAARHGIDPEGAALYTNPVNGSEDTFPNIAGHRDVNATECPGSSFYATLPELRTAVAERIAAGSDTTPPAAPTGLRAKAGDGSVTLAWDPNGEADLAGYHVYRAAAAGGPYERLTTSPLADSYYTDAGLINDTTYYYVVTAVDASANESPRSAEVSATPVPGHREPRPRLPGPSGG